MMFARADVLKLYRNILKNAKVFPSRNRERIYKEIVAEFKSNKNLTDSSKLALAFEKASSGLGQLSKYTSLKHSQTSWVVELEKEPMPKRK